jgi:hypothetical protein
MDLGPSSNDHSRQQIGLRFSGNLNLQIDSCTTHEGEIRRDEGPEVIDVLQTAFMQLIRQV